VVKGKVVKGKGNPMVKVTQRSIYCTLLLTQGNPQVTRNIKVTRIPQVTRNTRNSKVTQTPNLNVNHLYLLILQVSNPTYPCNYITMYHRSFPETFHPIFHLLYVHCTAQSPSTLLHTILSTSTVSPI
jgi:hypothetical protein